jgi:autoinducer 2-degrading protein
MARLALVGTIEVAPRGKDLLVSWLLAHKARCLKDEPGKLQMEVLTPRGDDAKAPLYEVYQDDAAFDVHRNEPSFAQWRKETTGTIVKIDAIRCAIVESTV